MRSVKGLVCVGAGLVMASSPAFGQNLDDLLADELYLAEYTLSEVRVPEDRPQAFQTQFTFEGEQYTLDLTKHSVRSANYRVLVSDGKGGLEEVPTPPVSTYRGEVLELPGSVASASVRDDGIEVKVRVQNEDAAEIWTIQRLAPIAPNQPESSHVVYSADGMLPTPFECGVDHDHDDHQPAPDMPGTQVDTLFQAELAWDVDFQAYQELGSSVSNSVAEVEGITNDVNVVYERDVDITHIISETIVRETLAENPYTTNNAQQYLNQVINEWTGPQADVPRDVVHALTGRNISGGVIGIANLGSICASSGAAVSENLSNSLSETGLVAHELGHNWNAPHCDNQPQCNIMCSGLGGCNGLGDPNFAPSTINIIENFRDSRFCLDEVIDGLVELPFFDDFPNGASFNDQLWDGTTGSVSLEFDSGAPSPSFAAQFSGSGMLTTLPIDTSAAGGPVFVSMFAQIGGVPAGNELTVEAQDGVDGPFVEIGSIESDGDFSPYTEHTFSAPGSAFGEGIQFRFSTDASTGIWRIDDVTIDAGDGFPLPFSHEFPSDTLDTNIWPIVGAFNDTGVSTDASNEPSPPYSLRLPALEIESVELLGGDAAGDPHVIRLFVQPGPNETSALDIAYRNDSGNLSFLDSIFPTNFPSNEFTELVYELPQDGFHNDLTIRFNNRSLSSSNAWFIDDVSVEPGTVNDCPADFNGDGEVTSGDFLAYIDAFAAGDPEADFNDDGSINSADFLAFIDAFSAGCP